MINSFADFREYVAQDFLQRRQRLTVRNLLLDYTARFTVSLRLLELLHNNNRLKILVPFFKLYHRRQSMLLGYSVPPNVFGPGVQFVHYGLLIVSPFARVGKNCRVHAGVNIGGTFGFYEPEAAKTLAPSIGDNCYIGPGAKIYGAIKIGNGVRIGTNAVVNKSFLDDNIVLAGVPARIVSRQELIDEDTRDKN